MASDEVWSTGLSLLNSTLEEVAVEIAFNTGEVKEVLLQPLEHRAFTVRQLFDGQPQSEIQSAMLRNAAGVIGLELFAAGNLMSGILIKDDASSVNYYPHIANDRTWNTGIVATNANDSGIDLTITPFADDGTELAAKTVSLGPGEKYVGAVTALDLPSDAAWLRIDGSAPFSGFELFGTNDGDRLAGYTGVDIDMTQGCFVKLEKNGWTGIAFVNTENEAAAVTLTAYDDDGNAIAQKTLKVAPRAKEIGSPEDHFAGEDISGATYIAFSSDRRIVGFQLNNSTEDILLDALPGM